MIGGYDVVFPTVGDAATLEECARILMMRWPEVRFEDAITGDKYPSIDDIPFGRVKELLAYPNAESEAAWDSDCQDSAENTMLNFIVRPNEITIVLDNPHTPEMQIILNAIQGLLWTEGFYTSRRAENLGANVSITPLTAS